MAWWIAGGALLLTLAVGGGMLGWGAHQAARGDVTEEMRSWGRTGGRPPHEDDWARTKEPQPPAWPGDRGRESRGRLGGSVPQWHWYHHRRSCLNTRRFAGAGPDTSGGSGERAGVMIDTHVATVRAGAIVQLPRGLEAPSPL